MLEFNLSTDNFNSIESHREYVQQVDTSYTMNDSVHEDLDAENIVIEQTRALKEAIIYYLSIDYNSTEELKIKVEYQFNSSSPKIDELVALIDIISLINEKGNNCTAEILKGAHIRINDGGALYQRWSSFNSVSERISSHPSLEGSKQYAIRGPWVRELLFGIVEENGTVHTFFQLEKTPWKSDLNNRLGHAIDAIEYFFTGKNIGPYGNSIHTHYRPIVL